jgi:hypothetical protein
MLTADMQHLTSTLSPALASVRPAVRPVVHGQLAARAAATSAVFASRAATANDALFERARLRAETFAQLTAS